MTELPYKIIPVPHDWDRSGLPAWTYHSPAMFALEREKLFLTHWQLVGHEYDVPNPGDWVTYDLLGERAVVMRGQDGLVRAFHNLWMARRNVARDQWFARFTAGSIFLIGHGADPRPRMMRCRGQAVGTDSQYRCIGGQGYVMPNRTPQSNGGTYGISQQCLTRTHI